MINHGYAYFVPLLNQLQRYGKFSSYFSVNSPSVKKISDYIFSELKTQINDNRFAHSGTFFDIDCCDHQKIVVSTVLTFNCQHIKSFCVTKAEYDLLLKHFDEISMVYTHLFFQRSRFGSQKITVMYREVTG